MQLFINRQDTQGVSLYGWVLVQPLGIGGQGKRGGQKRSVRLG